VKKKLFLFMFTFLVSLLNATPVDLKVPNLFNGVFEQYSYNFINVEFAGRGNTGVATIGRVGHALYNPASFYTDEDHLSFELLAKFNTSEFNIDFSDDSGETYTDRYTLDNTYKSPRPISFIGIGLSPIKDDWNIALSYALTRSIKYDSFSRQIGGAIYNFTPMYRESQYTFTVNRAFGPFVAGLNTIFVHQMFDDYILEGAINSVSFTELIFRYQVGGLYDMGGLKVGLSYMPQVVENIAPGDLSMDVDFPSHIIAGVSYKTEDDFRVCYDLEILRFRETSRHLDNQIVHKIGSELPVNKYILRAGFIYKPSVFSGLYSVPVAIGDNSLIGTGIGESLFIPDYGHYKKTDMYIATLGVSWELTQHSRLHLATMRDFGDVRRLQIMAGFDIDFIAFDRR
jgi:hypothetical protein